MVSSSLFGRDRQTKKLDRLLERVLAGYGQVTLIKGEAGAGKTALVKNFISRAQEKYPEIVASIGNCSGHSGISDPYLPFREAIKQLLDAPESNGPNSQKNAKENFKKSNIVADAARILLEVGPDLIGSLVPGGIFLSAIGKGIAVKAQVADKLDTRKYSRENYQLVIDDELTNPAQIFEQFTNYIQTLSKKSPLILVIDDMQWADSSSISLFFHLSRRIERHQIALIGTFRPTEIKIGSGEKKHAFAEVKRDLERYFGDVVIDLDSTSDEENKVFVDALIEDEPQALGEEFRAKFLKKTNGHALFSVEMMKHLKESHSLVKNEQGLWSLGRNVDWEKMPRRAEQIIAARLDRLDSKYQEILCIAALQGEEFLAEGITNIENLHADDIVKILSGDLSRRHGIVSWVSTQRRNKVDLTFYKFNHNLFRQYLVNSLDEPLSRLLNRNIAQQLEYLFPDGDLAFAPKMAHHYLEASEHRKAFYYLQIAGNQAQQLFDYEGAIGIFEQALDVFAKIEDPSTHYEKERLGLQIALAKSFEVMGNYSEGEKISEETGVEATAVGDLEKIVETSLLVGRLYGREGDYETGLSELMRSQRIANKLNKTVSTEKSKRLLAEIHRNIALILMNIGELVKANQHLRMAQNLCTPDSLMEIRIQHNRGTIYFLETNLEAANEKFHLAQKQLDENKSTDVKEKDWIRADILVNSGMLEQVRGNFRESEDLFRSAMEIYAKFPLKRNIAVASAGIGYSLTRSLATNEIRPIEKKFNEAIAAFEDIGHLEGKRHALTGLSLLYAKTGDFDQADRALETIDLLKGRLKYKKSTFRWGEISEYYVRAQLSMKGQGRNSLAEAKMFANKAINSASDIVAGIDDKYALAFSYRILGDIEVLLGNDIAAETAHKNAKDAFPVK